MSRHAISAADANERGIPCNHGHVRAWHDHRSRGRVSRSCATCEHEWFGSCRTEYHRAYKKTHRRAHRVNGTRWLIKARSIATAAKDRPCADCGVRFPSVAMDFDHVRGVKVANVSHMVLRGVSPDVLNAEIAKCEVVCSNCHRIRTQLRHEERRNLLFQEGD